MGLNGGSESWTLSVPKVKGALDIAASTTGSSTTASAGDLFKRLANQAPVLETISLRRRGMLRDRVRFSRIPAPVSRIKPMAKKQSDQTKVPIVENCCVAASRIKCPTNPPGINEKKWRRISADSSKTPKLKTSMTAPIQ